MSSKIGGIDYSLVSPAVCVHTTNRKTEWNVSNCVFYYIDSDKRLATGYASSEPSLVPMAYPNWRSQESRHDALSDCFMPFLIRCSHIGVEGYAMGAKGKVFNLAENHGVLKHKIYKCDIPMNTYPPTVVKKFATGKGNSKKDMMEKAFEEETGYSLRERINKVEAPKSSYYTPVGDIIDAYFICKMTFMENIKQ